MALPRAVSTSIDKFAARLSLITERTARLERSAHRHEGTLALQPVGTILDYLGLVAPSTAWVLLEGQTLLNAATLYPALWNIAPASIKSGNSLLLPDTRGKVLVGRDPLDPDFDEIGDTGGAKTVSLTSAQLPSHSHGSGTLAAASSGTLFMSGGTGIDGSHFHTVRDYPVGPLTAQSGTNLRQFRDNVPDGQNTSTAGAHSHSVSVSGADHGHSISGNTGATGTGDAHPNVQPYVVTVKILKVL